MESRRWLAAAALGALGAGGVTGAGGPGRRSSDVAVASRLATVTAAPAPPASTNPDQQLPPSAQTYPRVLPRVGSRSSRFAVYFTLREEPGHRGVLATDYRIAVDSPAHARSRCQAPAGPDITSGHAGDVVRVLLRRPARDWCAGRYTVTTFLQRGPYCPPPPPGGPPNPCPAFASRASDAGRAHFVVR